MHTIYAYVYFEIVVITPPVALHGVPKRGPPAAIQPPGEINGIRPS